MVGQSVARGDRRGGAAGERFAGRSGPLRLLVVGGSLGALALNERIPHALARLPADARPLVVHQAGGEHLDALRAAYERVGVAADCRAFISDMAESMQAPISCCAAAARSPCRAGCGGHGAIIVPLPGAIADEQSANAHFLVARPVRRSDPASRSHAERLAECCGA
jgi:UDP-N-acetylglucosamine--N-acetylmuramyl-(pentapeptide) pyrophosphoryl-undecaprenol N-acetylglucosamine transferase